MISATALKFPIAPGSLQLAKRVKKSLSAKDGTLILIHKKNSNQNLLGTLENFSA